MPKASVPAASLWWWFWMESRTLVIWARSCATAECAGVNGVFIPERRAAGLNETVAKASAGATEHLPIARVTNLSRLIEQLKERNVWIVGTAAEAGTNYTEWDWTRPSAVVLGGEGSGLHRLVRSIAMCWCGFRCTERSNR